MCAAVWFPALAAPPADSAGETAGAAPALCPGAPNFKIAIDVGHTPEAKGATSARGVPEIEFNTALARKIEYALQAHGYRKITLLFANGIGRIQLAARTAKANRLGADLLLSIHHDSVQPIYLQNWTFEGHRYDYSDKFAGYSLFVSRKSQAFDRSRAFATALGSELMSRGFHQTLHHAEPIKGEGRNLIDQDRGIYAYDELFVLKETRMPAVLLEAGIIVNRDEEIRLKKPERQELMAAAVAAAVDRVCASTR